MQTISIHAPREGGDSSANRCRSCWIHFNPRPPRGGRRPSTTISSSIRADFNPRPPRGGRQSTKKTPPKKLRISIHAPREGGDDFPEKSCIFIDEVFQSTPPARGATRISV